MDHLRHSFSSEPSGLPILLHDLPLPHSSFSCVEPESCHSPVDGNLILSSKHFFKFAETCFHTPFSLLFLRPPFDYGLPITPRFGMSPGHGSPSLAQGTSYGPWLLIPFTLRLMQLSFFRSTSSRIVHHGRVSLFLPLLSIELVPPHLILS